MRQAGLAALLLVGAAHLAACTAGSAGRDSRGQSGSVAWEVADVRQSLEQNGARMRWDFWLVLRNTGDTGIRFEQAQIGSRAGGAGDVSGGMGTTSFTARLDAGGELRIPRSESWTCRDCNPAHLPRFFADGIIVYYTLLGRDDRGNRVRVPVAIRFDSSVGQRQ